jgi:hypothetical protein
MTPNQTFDILNLTALVAWVLLALSPRLPRWTSTVTGTVIPVVLAVAYTAIVVTMWGGSEGGFSSLADVAALFRHPWILLAGWTGIGKCATQRHAASRTVWSCRASS